jgi:ATP-dependent DNA helicase UvrD/PcrA
MNPPTEEQKQIIETKIKIISLNASGGTGKTETIAWFVFNRVEKYERIALITYTNSAADSMRKNLRKAASFNEDYHFVGTIHRFSNRILHKYTSKIGYKKGFKLRPGITNKLLNQLIRKNKKHLNALDKPFDDLKEINSRFLRSNYKVINIAEDYLHKKYGNYRHININQIRKIILRIKRDKKKLNVMDYGDLVYYFYILLKQNESVVQSIAKAYPLMIVDEFQDTTDIQWKAMRLLINEGMEFLGAGDPYQTLYRFAGASTNRFQQLEAIPKCAKYNLTQNHRSTNQIISLSNAIRAQLDDNKPKVWSKDNGPMSQVILSHQMSLLTKAILNKIRAHMDKDKISLDEMAVTFRFNKDVYNLRKALKSERIPYIMFENDGKDRSQLSEFVLSIINISLNKGNKEYWNNILPLLKGVGAESLYDILSHLKKLDYHHKGLKAAAGKRYKEDLAKLKKIIQNTYILKNNPLKAFEDILKFYGGLKKRKKINYDDPCFMTMEKMVRVSKNIQDFILNYNDPSYGVYHPFASASNEYLTLSNIHKIKGKGFKVVFILGANDRIFESFKTFDDEASIRDEIMIMDTAVTRSKRYLYFLFPMTKKDWDKKIQKINPSVFIRNCSKDLYDFYTIRDVRG